MARIPEVSHKEPKVVSLLDRVRPWLYLAGVFAGLLVFSRLLISPVSQEPDDWNDHFFYVQTLVSGEMFQVVSEDDLDYFEFMESQYLDRILAEELDGFESELEDIANR
jgi:hypothetical protein